MRLHHLLLAVSLLSVPFAVGCAGEAGEDADSSGAAVSTGQTQGAERKAILNAVHARLAKDFAGATSPTLKGFKLVFDVHQLDSNATKAFFRGRVLKQDSAGKTHELTTADFKGTELEEAIKEGFFDGPEVIAALTKKGGTWSIATRAYGDAGAADEIQEAYVVGPTDVAWTTWDADFGIPSAWTGFSTEDAPAVSDAGADADAG